MFDTSPRVKVFVYGTLKRGKRNDIFLKGAEFLGKAFVDTPLALFKFKNLLFPMAAYPPGPRTGQNIIKGELYSVSYNILHSLLYLEGVAPDESSSNFKVAHVIAHSLEGRRAEMCIMFYVDAAANTIAGYTDDSLIEEF